MTPNRTILTLIAALAFAGAATSVHAQQISEARIHELIKQAADRAVRADVVVDAQQPAATAAQNRPVIHLALEDAVKFALDRNLDIAVQRLNPEINDIAYASIRTVYHPNLTSTVGAQSTKNPSTTTISGSTQAGAAVAATLDTYNGGIAQSVPWGGGSFSVALTTTGRRRPT